MRAVLVAGTWSWTGETPVDWWAPDSAFARALAAKGVPVVSGAEPFIWDTELGGVGFGTGDLKGWKAAGRSLYHYCVPPLCPGSRVPPEELLIITHSHGLQVALAAFAAGLQGTLVDIAGPVRNDMLPLAKQARPNLRRWVHMHAGKRDRWQVFGALFDGHRGIERAHPLADQNISIPDVDHGALLRMPVYFPIVFEALGV